ncbi:hypothetical protein B9Z19DRAFT_1130367 [Tuber borchii]|uniref:Uncharacterized protein n=1 Tax=Tuber borchii TaxID=42251 RepID=A0A2T6ZKN0_TUBBO|nr:hypothetical protein B9Z19DRAFT_1130367 [Tuber borchii]
MSSPARVHRYSKNPRWHSSRGQQTTLFASSENSVKPAVTHEEYVYSIRSQKVASMYSNPGRALAEIKVIRSIARRLEAMVDFTQYLPGIVLSGQDGEPVFAVYCGISWYWVSGRCSVGIRFYSDVVDKVLTYWRDKELGSSPFVPLTDEAPLARFGLDEWDTDGEGEVEDDMDEAPKIWRDMKAKKSGSGGGESFWR